MKNSKRIFLQVGFLLFAALAARAHNAVATPNFGLRRSGGSKARTVELGATKSQTIQVLGPPTKTSRFYSEIDEKWLPVLYYGSNKLTFLNNRLAMAELSDARLTVGKPGTAGFRVGSALPKPKPGAKPALAFGTFNVEYKPGTSYGVRYSAISSGNMKTPKGKVLDVAYEIHYDQQNRVAHVFLDETYD
ncbi:MAG: hypothetical protein EOO56_20930 [Hymenobacter sp.]|nr:MAG: hypothetical protein EOO56_20930 [Hymenobacter sp.]